MTISQTQFDACMQAERDRFVQRMENHLRYVLPDECSALGDTGLRELIGVGIDKAATYGIQIEYGVAKFITLMLMFGTDFCNAPEHPWTRQVLNDTELDESACKGELLYEAALEHSRIEEGIDEDDE